MSLITEINRTETEKEKVKKVATQIDNKLVALGGQQATDLADVPNKMQEMTKQYSKFATGNLDIRLDYSASSQEYVDIDIPINFDAKIIFLKFTWVGSSSNKEEFIANTEKGIYSEYAEGCRYIYRTGASYQYSFWLTKKSSKKVEIRRASSNASVKAIKWMAIG